LTGRWRAAAIVLCAWLLVAPLAAQEPVASPAVYSRGARRRVLLYGFFGAGFALVVPTGLAAGIAWRVANPACTETRSQDSSFRFCGADGNPRRAAAIGGAVGFALGASWMIPDGIAQGGQASGLHGSRRAAAAGAVPTVLITLGLSTWAMASLRDRGPAVLAPLGVGLGLTTVVAPVAAAYLAYRASHFKHAAAAVIFAPLLSRNGIGVSAVGRF
jgi:hypothetical protein